MFVAPGTERFGRAACAERAAAALPGCMGDRGGERGAAGLGLLAHTHTHTRAHTKGRSHIRARPRGGGAGGEDAQRPFRAPALAAAGGASPHFERGFSLRRGRQNGGGGGASPRPSGRTWRPRARPEPRPPSASGQVGRAGSRARPRAPGHPNFPRARFEEEKKLPDTPVAAGGWVAAGVAFVPHPCLLGETSDRTCLVRAETHLGAKAIGNGGLSRPWPRAVAALPSKV